MTSRRHSEPRWDDTVLPAATGNREVFSGVRLSQTHRGKTGKTPVLRITIGPDVLKVLGWVCGDKIMVQTSAMRRQLLLIRQTGGRGFQLRKTGHSVAMEVREALLSREFLRELSISGGDRGIFPSWSEEHGNLLLAF